MSARAAWRLEAMGFAQVYRYAAGKADWLAAGLPTEGTETNTPRAGAVARTDVPTCAPGDRVDQAAERARQAGWETCIVVNADRIVVGRLRRDALAGGEATVEQVMEEGPTTIRASEELAGLVQRMRNRNVPAIVVTDPDGRFLGVLRRVDAERALAGGGLR